MYAGRPGVGLGRDEGRRDRVPKGEQKQSNNTAGCTTMFKGEGWGRRNKSAKRDILDILLDHHALRVA